MRITHVLRGEEFIASMPKFLSLMDAFGWERPKFATLPPVLNRHGGKKLSKRDGAKDVLDYRDLGYLPQAVNNFLASLGWNDGTQQEIFTLEELVSKFTLERIQRKGAKFDTERLDWINAQHIRRLDPQALLREIERAEAAAGKSFWPKAAKTADDAYKLRVLSLVKERLRSFAELADHTEFFFVDPKLEANELAKLSQGKLSRNQLEKIVGCLRELSFTAGELENGLRAEASRLGLETRPLFMTMRYALTGKHVSPGLFEIIAVLGKNTVVERLERAYPLLNN